MIENSFKKNVSNSRVCLLQRVLGKTVFVVERTSPPPTPRPTPRKEVQWRLYSLELSPPRFTRPLRSSLALWDIKVRRLTSPTYRPPQLLSLPKPRRLDRVTRGTQCQPAVVSQEVQTDDLHLCREYEQRRGAVPCSTPSTHDEKQHPPVRMSSTPEHWDHQCKDGLSLTE